jgi:hypothetical protein
VEKYVERPKPNSELMESLPVLLLQRGDCADQ